MTIASNIYNDDIPHYFPQTNSSEYISFSTCGHRIARHLNSLNTTLQLLDEDLVQYRKSVTSEISLNDFGPHSHTEEDKELLRKIKTELRIYHLYKKYTLKIVCQNFCYKDEHLDII